jgi:hypothetical protein
MGIDDEVGQGWRENHARVKDALLHANPKRARQRVAVFQPNLKYGGEL